MKIVIARKTLATKRKEVKVTLTTKAVKIRVIKAGDGTVDVVGKEINEKTVIEKVTRANQTQLKSQTMQGVRGMIGSPGVREVENVVVNAVTVDAKLVKTHHVTSR